MFATLTNGIARESQVRNKTVLLGKLSPETVIIYFIYEKNNFSNLYSIYTQLLPSSIAVKAMKALHMLNI